MRFKIILAVLLLWGLAVAQFNKPWQLFFTGKTATELDSTSSDSVDYLFTDTTGNINRTDFAGAPLRTCMTLDSGSTGDDTDSTTVTYKPLIYFDGTTFTTSSDAAKSITNWTNLDWTDGNTYDEIITLDGPVLGIRFYYTYTANEGTGGTITANNWILKQ